MNRRLALGTAGVAAFLFGVGCSSSSPGGAAATNPTGDAQPSDGAPSDSAQPPDSAQPSNDGEPSDSAPPSGGLGGAGGPGGAGQVGSGGADGGGDAGRGGTGPRTPAGGAPQGGATPAGGAPPRGGAAASAGASSQGGEAGASRGGSAGAEAALGGAGGAEAELPPHVPDGYSLVYDESFREPESFDQLFIANAADWFHSPEGFVEFTAATYAPPHRSPFSVALIKGLSASSFVLEVEMMQTGVGEAHRDMVILWNVVSPSEFYYAHVSEQHDDVAHHLHIVNFADRAPITETFTAGFDWGTDAWRTLRVVRDATSGVMEVHDVDEDELILSASDTTFTTGFFGVGSFDNTGRVRNLKIWSPDATTRDIPFTF